MMHIKSVIQICTAALLVAVPAFGAPTTTVAVSVKPLVQSKARKAQKRIDHPVLLRVKQTRTHARSKTKATAKQFDLSGALRAAK
jgi:hypothetical protein